MPGPSVQIFGAPDSSSTRAALRFFKERRIDVHLVDVRRKRLAPAELRRFVERLGARAVADEESKAWRDSGLGFLRMDDFELAERLLTDQRLLRLPLVRFGNAVAAGRDEAAWKSMAGARHRVTSPRANSAAAPDLGVQVCEERTEQATGSSRGR